MNRDNEVGETKDLKFAPFRLLDAFRIRRTFRGKIKRAILEIFFPLDENIPRYLLIFDWIR